MMGGHAWEVAIARSTDPSSASSSAARSRSFTEFRQPAADKTGTGEASGPAGGEGGGDTGADDAAPAGACEGTDAGGRDTPTAGRSGEPSAVSAATAAEGSFFLRATLELLADQANTSSEVGRLLPALQAVLARCSIPPGDKDAESLERVQKWASEQAHERDKRGEGRDAPSGWLKKLDRTKLSVKARWCVLDGQRLLYYADKAETVLRGALNLEGCRVTASSAIRDLRRYTFEIKPAAGVTINPLHRNKQVYTFVAASETERKWWIRAISTAAGVPQVDATVLQWQQLLRSAVDASGYSHVLAELSKQAPVSLLADHVRARAAEARRSGLAAGGHDTDAVEVEADQVRRAAVLSAETRHMGHNPGDRVSMEQLVKDVQRDKVALGDIELSAVEAGDIIVALTRKVELALDEAEARLAAAAAADAAERLDTAGGAGSGSDDRSSSATATTFTRPSPASVVRFAREVLLCSSRTVAGGDAYDAVELVFGGPHVIIAPDSGSDAPPVNIEVKIGDAGAAMDRSRARSSAAVLRRSERDADGSDGDTAEADRESSGASGTTPGRAVRRRLHWRSLSSGTSARFLRRRPRSPAAPAVAAGADTSEASDTEEAKTPAEVSVTVLTWAAMRYRLLDAESPTDTLGVVEARFSRQFTCGERPKPAEVSLSVAEAHGVREAAV